MNISNNWISVLYRTQLASFVYFEPKNKYPFGCSQFFGEGYSTPHRLDRTFKGGSILLNVSEDVPSWQIKLKSFENYSFLGIFAEIYLKKRK